MLMLGYHRSSLSSLLRLRSQRRANQRIDVMRTSPPTTLPAMIPATARGCFVASTEAEVFMGTLSTRNQHSNPE